MESTGWNKELLREELNPMNWSWIFSRRTFIVIASSIAMFYLTPFVTNLVETVFVLAEPATSIGVDVLVFGLLIFLFLFIVHKIRIDYKPSFNQYLILTLFLFGYSLIRFGERSFQFDNFHIQYISEVKYLDVLAFCVIIFPAWKILSFKWLKRWKNPEQPINNIYFEDQPKQNVPSHAKLVRKLTNAIKSDHYEGSFSVGVIGSWGQGKSSFINSIKKELKSNKTPSAIIEVNFSPFLNHKEDEVIVEFFTSFSDQLREYSGRLSKSILQYSGSLTKLYKKGELTELLTKTGITENKPAHKLYEEINTQIKEIGRKVVVFIDDLDRLSSHEILQVLKLIRNTSNFNNTIFVLALDKNYVVNALASDKSYMESKFIEKFFQLEVYLPEIDRLKLMDQVTDMLSRSREFDNKYLPAIKSALLTENVLFDDYVENFREAIRLANQIVFEHSVVDDLTTEVLVKDFINLIFLKNRYPIIFQDLCNHKHKYLDYSDGIFSLRREDSEGNKRDDFDIWATIQSSTPSLINYDRFEIQHSIEANKSESNLTPFEKQLLVKTLVELFGHDHPSPKSVMQERIFWKLMRLRHEDQDLLEKEFRSLLSWDDNRDEWQNTLNQLLNSDKGNQIISRINYHTITSKSEVQVIAALLFQLWNNSERYKLFTTEIIRLLSTILNLNNYPATIKPGFQLTDEETKQLVQNEFFEAEGTTLENKVYLLALLKDSENETKLWGFSSEELTTKGLELFMSFLEQFESHIWDIKDFGCYHIYHNVKKFCDEHELNKVLKSYLKKVEIATFCAQVLDKEAFTILSYKISEFVVELFGSYLHFQAFLTEHPDCQKSEIQEFLKFFEVQRILSFNRYTKFVFKDLKIRDYQEHGRISEHERIQSEKLVQLYIKFATSLHEFTPDTNALDFNYARTYFVIEETKYMFIGTTQKPAKECLSQIFTVLESEVNQKLEIQSSSEVKFESEQATILNEAGDLLFELVSIQHGI